MHIFILTTHQILSSLELKSHWCFWQGPLKNDWINFQPSWICTSMQKNSLVNLFTFEIQSNLESHDQAGHRHAHPINFWSPFNFCDLYQHVKNQFILFDHSVDIVNWKVPSHDWPHPFLTMPTTKIFNHLLICMNLYQHAKNQLILEIQ